MKPVELMTMDNLLDRRAYLSYVMERNIGNPTAYQYLGQQFAAVCDELAWRRAEEEETWRER